MCKCSLTYCCGDVYVLHMITKLTHKDVVIECTCDETQRRSQNTERV